MGMRVFLTKKLADLIDGVDLTSRRVGDVFDVSAAEGRLLLAEQWAIRERRSEDRPKEWPPQGESSTTQSRQAGAPSSLEEEAGTDIASDDLHVKITP
jgi:hypothetical protein